MGASSKHFSDHELACHHCGLNGCTQELVDGLEEFRARCGQALGYEAPVMVNSAYRCHVHNASTPNAAKNSQHQEGTAADVHVPGMTAKELYKVAETIPCFQHGGIGVAVQQHYVHLDVRATKARWCYDDSGRSCSWDRSLDT